VAPRRDANTSPRRSTAHGPSGLAFFVGSPAGVFVVAGLAVVVVAALILVAGRPNMPRSVAATPVPGEERGPSDAADGPPRAPDPSKVRACAGMPCPSIGPDTAKVEVIEVTDYRCGYCRDFLTTTARRLQATYAATGKIRFISHVYASSADTRPIAAAALCAAEQGRYFEFQARAFDDDIGALGADATGGITETGRAVVPDYNQFESCVRSARYFNSVSLSTIEAQEAGVAFTPSVFVDGLLIEGAMDDAVYTKKIDQALAGADAGS
jgi:protein-disulfide isomerase